jgi:hypothetical protein
MSGTSQAEFQTFTDEASFLAAIAEPSSQSSQSGGSALQASSDSGSWTGFSGSSLTFNAGSTPLVGVGGFFQLLAGSTISVSLDDNVVATFTPPTDGFGFFGILFWAGFNTVVYDGQQDTQYKADTDNFTFATMDGSMAVPAPPSFTLFGMGAVALLVGCGISRRKRGISVVA